MPGFLIEALYEFKLDGVLTEEGYNIATNVLDILILRNLINNNLRIYRDDEGAFSKITIEVNLTNYTLYIDVMLDNSVDIYKVTSGSCQCQDYTIETLNNMYQYLISL